MTSTDRNFARRVDPATLQLFIAVCEYGSIGRAAEHEFIAASALSKRISALEAALDTPLLYRHARGVSPTPGGECLLHHARSLMRGLDKMQGEISEYALGVRGHVRVWANISAIVEFLPEDLCSFARQHPQIKIDLEEHVSVDVIRAVQEGAADIGICNPQVSLGELQSMPYRRDKLLLVVPRGHRFAAYRSISFAQTLDEDHVGLHSTSAIYLAMRRAAAAAGRPIRLRIQVTGLDAMCRMIHNRLGVGLIPDRAYQLLRHMGALEAVALTDDWSERNIQLVARDFAALPVAARQLADHLKAGTADPSAPPASAASNGDGWPGE